MATKSPVSAAGIGGGVGAAAGPAVVVGCIQGVGFTSSGIAAGSTAAVMMSEAALAGGGGVAAGSTVATLQSIGSLGALGMAASLGAAACGAVVGASVVGGIVKCKSVLSAKVQKCQELRDSAAKSPVVVEGAWMVVTEEGKDNIVFYPFTDEAGAMEFVNNIIPACVLFDPRLDQVHSGGVNPWACNRIRTRVLAANDGPWKVVAEEGPGNVQYYYFDAEHKAKAFHCGLFWPSILFGPDGAEISSGGINPWALNTIRTRVSTRRRRSAVASSGRRYSSDLTVQR